MNLTPEEVLDSPITEDAIVVFTNGTMLPIDSIAPVADDEDEFIVFDDISGNIRLSATTTEGLVVYFDSADVLYIELGPQDSETILADEEAYEGPEQEPIEVVESSVHYGEIHSIDDLLAQIFGADIFAGKSPEPYDKKSFLDDQDACARASVENAGKPWSPPRF